MDQNSEYLAEHHKQEEQPEQKDELELSMSGSFHEMENNSFEEPEEVKTAHLKTTPEASGEFNDSNHHDDVTDANEDVNDDDVKLPRVSFSFQR